MSLIGIMSYLKNGELNLIYVLTVKFECDNIEHMFGIMNYLEQNYGSQIGKVQAQGHSCQLAVEINFGSFAEVFAALQAYEKYSSPCEKSFLIHTE